ncbi:MAG: rRNA maturation RNase YbeY [Candidatus Alcyoniella australis]|nr:rRNA maturation RNase YbeY [Candidatus Alcyoniella australis]
MAQEVRGTELSVLLCDDREIHRLNFEYRGVDKATDVLSFSMLEGEDALEGELLGDVVISLERCAAQARSLGVGYREELARLLAHGICHLLGMDHVHGGLQARKMRRVEEHLAQLSAALLDREE